MRTDTEMINLILQIADTLEVEAVTLSDPEANPPGNQRRVSRLRCSLYS